VKFPIRPLRGAWPQWMESKRQRFFRYDPGVILEDDVTPRDFRRAMLSIHVGGTYKITHAGRHEFADDLLLRHLDLSSSRIVEMGASDGSTSVDLIRRLGDGFRSFAISDKYIELTSARVGRHIVLFDHDDRCVLVIGRRFVAWPEMSSAVHALYSRIISVARTCQRTTVPLLNPDARAMVRDDPRVTFRAHDVFEPWAGDTPDLVRAANVLRKLYFDDRQLLVALAAIHSSLSPGGHFQVIDHHRVALEIPPRSGLYRATSEGYEVVEETEHRPEIADLVLAVRPDAIAFQQP
jgi:hypothetical protein